MIVPGVSLAASETQNTQSLDDSQNQAASSQANNMTHLGLCPTQPTMLFCNPNACFYEYLYYQTEWVDFYVNMGVNVVIWNYRGYGRSQSGSISPTAFMKDG